MFSGGGYSGRSESSWYTMRSILYPLVGLVGGGGEGSSVMVLCNCSILESRSYQNSPNYYDASGRTQYRPLSANSSLKLQLPHVVLFFVLPLKPWG